MAELRFPGVLAAVTTPFRADGSVDRDRFGQHCAWLISEGVRGVIPNGSLGEYEALTGAERAAAVEIAVEAVGASGSVVPGVSGKSAAEAVRWTEQARGAGAAAVMCLPPTSHAPTDDEVVAHFTAVAEVGLPVIVYNNPFSTRVDLTAPLLELCMRHAWDEALPLYRGLLPALRWDADPTFVQAIKLGQDEAGRYGGPVRLPRLPLDAQTEATVRKAVTGALETAR